MTEKELDEIRNKLINTIYRNSSIMFNDFIRGGDEYCNIDLIEVITDLYECLHFIITNEKELDEIRNKLINTIYRNSSIMFNDFIRGEDEYCNIDLIEVITDLYECLHFIITNESYDYMFHWANKVGSDVDTGNFIKIRGEKYDKNM